MVPVGVALSAPAASALYLGIDEVSRSSDRELGLAAKADAPGERAGGPENG